MTVTNRHYDVPPQVFEAFLDKRMKYTSGLYVDGAETLDEAQEAKLAFIARLLRLGDGMRVLDVGCGWGSLTLYLAGELGCRVTSVTPAPAQAHDVRRRAADAGVGSLVSVEVGMFEDLGFDTAGFDAVAMVGVIEHMRDRLAALRKARNLLRPSGRLYLSASCYRSNSIRAEYEDRPACAHATSVYGYAKMPSLSGLVATLEDVGLGITSLTDLTAHYSRTISDWQARITGSQARMDELAPGFAADLQRYFETANASWGYTANHYALTAVRSRKGELRLPA